MTDNLPVDWQTEMENQARAAAALERPAVGGISLRGGIMMYGDTRIPDNKLHCVVVASIFENTYYDKPFNPAKVEIPACFAQSLDGRDMVPYAEAQNKQAEECLGCPQMEWGTAGGGSRGKACKEKRKLMLMSGADLKDDPAKANLASMSLPVTSVKNWSKFVNDVALQFNRPLWGMAITIEVVPNAKSQFEVLFKPIGPLPDEYLPAVFARKAEAEKMLMTPYQPLEEQPQAAPPSGKKY